MRLGKASPASAPSPEQAEPEPAPVEEEPVTRAVAEPPAEPEQAIPEPVEQTEPEPTSRRSKLERLNEHVARLETEKQATLTKIVDLTFAEAEARKASLRENPDKRSDVGGALSPIVKLARDRKEAEAKLAGFDAELAAASVVRAELANEEASKVREEIVSEARRRNRSEAAHIEALAAWLESGLGLWGSYVRFLEERQACDLFASVTDAGVLAGLREQFKPLWQPTPLDFPAAVSMIYEAATDSRSLGVRDGLPWSRGLHIVCNLVEHVPDLRALNVYAPVSHPSWASEANPRAAEGRMPTVEWRNGTVGGAFRLGVGSIPN